MSEKQTISAEETFYVGDWCVDPTTGRISNRDVEHKIEPKAMTVLICLARQQGQVVSRETLEEQAWAGMVVGYDSLASAIIKLRKAFGDDSKSPRYIETVPKKGYRLICGVHTDLSGMAEIPEDKTQAQQSSPAERRSSKSVMAAKNHSAKMNKLLNVVILLAVLASVAQVARVVPETFSQSGYGV